MYNRRSSFLLAILLFLAGPGFAQSLGIEWQRPLAETLTGYWGKTILTSDNNLLVAGESARTASSNDIRLSKLKQNGQTIWNKTIGGSGAEDFIGMYNTPDGGYLIAATTMSIDGDVTGFHGGAEPDAWIVKCSASGAIEWQKCIGGTGVETFMDGAVQADGSFIMTGRTNSSNGDFMGNDGKDKAYVVKLSSTGNIIWKTFTGAGSSAIKKMLIKPNGNVLIGGDNYALGNKGMVDVFLAEVNTTGNVIMYHGYGGSSVESLTDIVQTGVNKFTVLATSSSTNGDVVGNHGNGDVWVFTIDNSGNIIWQRSIGGAQSEQGTNLSFLAADSSMIVSASTTSTDADMTGGHGNSDLWVGKLSNAGDLLWKRCLGGSGNEYLTQAYINAAGQTFLLGQTTSNNGDVSGYHGGQDLWIVKLTAGGALDWQKCLGGSLDESPASLNTEENGFTVLAGTPSKDGDVQGMHYKSDTGLYTTYNNDIWLLKFDNSGAINWQKTLGGYGIENPGNVLKINGKYFVSGVTTSNNGDVSGLQGKYNTWVVKLGETNVIKGTVFFDLNSNGIKDANESFYDEVQVKSTKNNYLRWSIPYNGQFKNEVDTGQLTTAVLLLNPYFTVVPVSKQSSFTNYFLIDSVDFALQPIPGKRDIAVNVFPVGAARPGFNGSYRLYYENKGTDTVASGKVYLLKDSRTVFVNAVPAPDLVNGDTLTWNYSNLKPLQSASIAVELNIKAPPVVNVNDTLQYRAMIDPPGQDQLPANNNDTLKQVVTGSFDPNSKSEGHAGKMPLAGVAGGSYLTYVINFQNLGTDTAFTVVVRDTLDAKLDWRTLQMIGASHAWSLQVNDSNKCTWTFRDIKLPHSTINEPASHGYIVYRIKPLSTLSGGSRINNSASIYFDYNLDVTTNTAVTLVQSEPVPKPIISGLANNYCSNLGAQKVKMMNLPGGGTTTTVKLDNAVLPVLADSTASFTLSSLTAGSHTINVTYNNTGDAQTTTADFTVTAAVTPDVNVSANTTQVTNLANPVMITAVNATGGGKDPLYTFGWKRDLTSIIQAESVNNTVNIAASSLAIGDNLVYVRMKTSETCYTTQTNVDSITIRRDQATGLTDVDNPGRVIDIYPNPFRETITIKGLSPIKSYVINIYNLHGQLLYAGQVINRTTTTISGLKAAPGACQVSIYDEKKKRLLGTVSLIRQ